MQKTLFALLLAACLLVTACGKTETPPVTENTTEATTSVEVTSATAETTTETTTQTEATLPPASGGTSPCYVHDMLYHCFPYTWVETVGEDAFRAWFAETESASAEDEYGCPYSLQNIYAFIHAFDYPKDVFIEQYNTDITIDWCFQVDLLYGNDAAAVESYYRISQNEIRKLRKSNESLRTLKWSLLDQYPDKLRDYVNWKEHSLLEMLEIAGIDLSDAQALSAQDTSLNEDLPLHFDAVATMSADEQKELLTEHSAFYQDCVLLGETPYETPYEKQVADNEETARIKKERGLDLCAQICCAHNLLYHSYFDPWIAYVGADTLEAWSNAEILAHYPSTVECPYPTANVYNFIHTFNYPKERFIEDFNTVLGIEYDYPVDLLYGDDPAAVERYFAELVDRHTKMEEDAERLGDWKYDLRQQYPEQFRDYYNWKQHSLLEMLTASGADLSDAKALNETAAQYGLQLRFDTIAAMDADALTALTEHSAFYQDCVLLGETPYETPYEKQVADNAAQ